MNPEFKSNTLPRMSDARLTLQKQEARGRQAVGGSRANNPGAGL